MTRFITAICLSVLFAGFVSANSIVIDFQSLEHEDAEFVTFGSQFSEDGFLLTEGNGEQMGTVGTLESRFSGSTAVAGVSSSALYILTRQGGGSFDLQSIDLAEFSTTEGEPISVNFTGILSDGNVASQSFSLDGTAFAAETFTFDSSFDSVVALVWQQSSPGHQFDNIVISQIPEPSSFVILSAVAVLASSRRRR